MDEVWYCGFNGFRQVPSQPDRPTLTTLVSQQVKLAARSVIVDVAVCWNYLIVAEPERITKYGLVEGRNGLEKLDLPPGTGKNFVQVSATPRHLLAVTDIGECWTYEEAKGWRKVHVGSDKLATTPDAEKDDKIPSGGEIDDSEEGENGNDLVRLVKTSCGDAHNIGLDSCGRAYALPSPLDFDPFPSSAQHRVTDVVCGKEHCLLLTEHGQVYSWGGGSRGQLGHGSLNSEPKPRVVAALDGVRVCRVAAGGWHSAAITQHDDLYMFGWNESGQLAQPTNLAKPAECFSAVEKLLMACCTMQPEDAALPRGDDSEDCEVYQKRNAIDESSDASADSAAPSANPAADDSFDKETPSCYSTSGCNADTTDLVVVQALPMLVTIPTSRDESNAKAIDVSCGSRHTVVLTKANVLWAFGWNKYGQLGLGHTTTKDMLEKVSLPRSVGKGSKVKMLRCGDWGTAIVVAHDKKQ